MEVWVPSPVTWETAVEREQNWALGIVCNDVGCAFIQTGRIIPELAKLCFRWLLNYKGKSSSYKLKKLQKNLNWDCSSIGSSLHGSFFPVSIQPRFAMWFSCFLSSSLRFHVWKVQYTSPFPIFLLPEPIRNIHCCGFF